MKPYRIVLCEMWRKDDWFAELAPDAKLVWIYTFTNGDASPAGIYRIALRTIANETGIALERVRAIIADFQAAHKLEYEGDVLWPFTMRKHQVGPLNPKDNLVKKIRSDLADLPQTPIVARYKAFYSVVEPPSDPLPRESEPPSEDDATGYEPLPVNKIHDTGYGILETGDGIPETRAAREESGKIKSFAATPPAPTPSGKAAPVKTETQPAPKAPSLQQEMFGALAETCQLDVHLKATMIGKTAKRLTDAGYKPPQVLAFRAWWQANDWRAKDSPYPSLAQVEEKIQQAQLPAPPNRGNGKDPGSAVKESSMQAAIRMQMEVNAQYERERAGSPN